MSLNPRMRRATDPTWNNRHGYEQHPKASENERAEMCRCGKKALRMDNFNGVVRGWCASCPRPSGRQVNA